MDILKPRLANIGGCVYRINPGDTHDSDNRTETAALGNLEEDFVEETDLLDNDNPDVLISQTDKGFEVSLNIPSSLFKFILGKQSESKKKIEYETRSQITVPRVGHEGPVVIRASARNSVLSAKTRVEVLAESGRSKLPFTHFLSIPLNKENIQSGFTAFRSAVLDKHTGERGVDESLFQKSEKLHLTLGTLTLLDDRELERASQIFHDCRRNIASLLQGRIKLEVKGLDYMNDDQTSVDVLYAKVLSKEDSLQKAVNLMVEAFKSEGNLNEDYQRNQVKLHMTVMNTLFRQDKTGAARPRGNVRKPRESFNARSIFKELGEFEFGICNLAEIHLSQRHSTACDGYYQPLTKLSVYDADATSSA